MTADVFPVVAPCNICGGKEFGRGPSQRLSITSRPPLCTQCRSLERHRIVRAVFNTFPDGWLTGTRCLQFSPDPALHPERFGEIVVSVWGGENSLDMQAIDLPDASFHWVYSSHVINHVPDAAAALREMLRVVGTGYVVLSVGGTVFNYETADSDSMFGPDRQFKLYGTLYADEIQRVLPDASLLELVAIDPCSVSLDSVYLVSVDEQKLTEMARAATAANVHARVFPALRSASPRKTAPHAAKASSAWDALQTEIAAWKASGASASFWTRDDDATNVEERLVELVDLCEREAVPLTLAVIPLPMTLQLVELIAERRSLTVIQHGFDHLNREAVGQPKSEFPGARRTVEAMRSIQLGRYILTEAFGERALPVFCPPWGTMAGRFCERLKDLGFVGYSGSRNGSEIHRRGTSPAGLNLASAHVAVNHSRRTELGSLAEKQILETLTAVVRAIRLDGSDEPVGIMTHHWGVDANVRDFLKRLFAATRHAGGTWVDGRDLFMPSPASGAQPKTARDATPLQEVGSALGLKATQTAAT